MIVFGYILLVVGLVAWLAGEVMILTVAYRRSFGCFFACLFLPVFYWIFLVMNVRSTAKPFAIAVIGLVAAGIGTYITGFESP